MSDLTPRERLAVAAVLRRTLQSSGTLDGPTTLHVRDAHNKLDPDSPVDGHGRPIPAAVRAL